VSGHSSWSTRATKHQENMSSAVAASCDGGKLCGYRFA
jgi:hypothetical protein